MRKVSRRAGFFVWKMVKKVVGLQPFGRFGIFAQGKLFWDWNVKNTYKEQFCSKNIWRFGTKTLPLQHISQINNCRLWNLVNFTSCSRNMGGEKMEVAGTNIMCIQTTITSSRLADTLRKKYRKGLSIKCWRLPVLRNNERTWSNTIPLYCQGWFLKWKFAIIHYY